MIESYLKTELKIITNDLSNSYANQCECVYKKWQSRDKKYR